VNGAGSFVDLIGRRIGGGVGGWICGGVGGRIGGGISGVGRWTALGTTSSRLKFSSVYLVDSWREVLRANISSGRRASYFFWSASQNWATMVFRVLFVLSTGFARGVYGGVSR
jgi:hypothetical protein